MPEDDAPRPRRSRNSNSQLKLRARTLYAEGETDLTALAKKLGTTRVSIWRWMKSDENAGRAWASRKDIRNAVVTDVTQRIATRIAAQEGVKYAEELVAVGEAAKLAAEYTKEFLDKAKNGEVLPGEKQSAADVYNTTMAGYARFASTVRENHGIKTGQPTLTEESTEDRGKKYVVVVEPAKTA